MEVRLIQDGERRALECRTAIRGAGDVLDLIGECGGHRTRAVLIEEEHLPAEFFDLRSGLAGEVLQKLQNYQIRLAVVMADVPTRSGRFGELVREANRGSQFRFFATRAPAEAWLLGGG
jgi:hypothetical protein